MTLYSGASKQTRSKLRLDSNSNSLWMMVDCISILPDIQYQGIKAGAISIISTIHLNLRPLKSRKKERSNNWKNL